MSAGTTYFTPELFAFLAELAANNDRGWFAANKGRYEKHVRDPFLRFIADFAAPLRDISAHLVADPRPAGGSLFRIHRDTRFSKDKSPYKTNIGAHFSYGKTGPGVQAPGFYLHLQPGHCFAASGMWRPEPPTLAKIRDAIVADPGAWKAVLDTGLEIGGETLSRPPRGYDPGHPFIADIKRKSFTAHAAIEDGVVTGAQFMPRFAAACRGMAPLCQFLAEAVDLPW